MSACVTKPFKLAQIEAVLVQWLGEARASFTAAAAAVQDRPTSVTPEEVAMTEVLDATVLQGIREIGADGNKLLERVCGLFVLHTPKLLERLCTQCGDDPAEFARAAHALKSMCRNIGAQRSALICEAIEGAAAGGRLPSQGQLETLQQTLDITIEELDAMLRVSSQQALMATRSSKMAQAS